MAGSKIGAVGWRPAALFRSKLDGAGGAERMCSMVLGQMIPAALIIFYVHLQYIYAPIAGGLF
jgi:hypothetical protein